MSDRPTISVTAAHYRRLVACAASRGVSVSSLVDLAAAHLPAVDVEPIRVSHELRARLRRACKGGVETISRTLERAINAAIDDSEQWPTALPRRRAAPMVAHAAPRNPGTRRRA